MNVMLGCKGYKPYRSAYNLVSQPPVLRVGLLIKRTSPVLSMLNQFPRLSLHLKTCSRALGISVNRENIPS